MKFQYTARDLKSKKVVKAVKEAEDKSALIESLKKQDMLPLKIRVFTVREEKGFIGRFCRRESVTSRDLIFFTHQLSATMKAGLLITEALDIVSDDLGNNYFGNVIKNIRNDIDGGADFTTAIKKYPKIFNEMYFLMIYTGELTGTLPESLENLAKHLDESEEVKDKLKTGLTYPVALVIFTFLIIFGIVVFIIPKFKKFFDEADQDIPAFTLMITNSSEFILHNIHYIFGSFIFAFIAFIILLRFKPFKEMIDDIKFKIPFVGPEILHKAMLARYCRTLGIMLGGGITMHIALTTLADIFENHKIRGILLHIKDRVISGAVLSEEILKNKMFPPLVGKMILIGEKTGRLEKMLTKTANYYDDQVTHNLKRLLVLIEPFMVAIAGIFVCIVVVAVYLPIFNLISVVKF